jgi:diguanylate cyclase (GGDEF)-like protein
MDESTRWFRESLGAKIDALEAARRLLLESPRDRHGEGIDTVRRLAHALRRTAGTHGFPEIRDLAALVEEAMADEIFTRLEHLLAAARRVASSEETEKAVILVIDADADTARTLLVALSGPNREVVVARTARQADQCLVDHRVSLMVLDLDLPNGDGRNLLLRVRAHPAMAGLPIIVLSVRSDRTTKAECFALGADGFFDKPIDPAILSAAVSARLFRESETQKDLRHDRLTGLPNRAAFAEAYVRVAALCARTKEPLSVAVLDLDRLKAVNETYGHAMGDVVLRRTASVISRLLRSSDVFARWGGEQFVALFPNTNPAGGARALKKVLRALRAEVFATEKGGTFQVTFSAGIAPAPEGAAVEDAIAEADRFLYLAKAAGRNRIVSAEDPVVFPTSKVLLAEDDDLTAAIVTRHLRQAGLDVVHVREGSAALSAALHGPTSLIILDVQTPGIDGFELLTRFRKLPSLASVPIVMLTSLGGERDVVRGLELGADDYVVKQFSPAELLARVQRLLKKR